MKLMLFVISLALVFSIKFDNSFAQDDVWKRIQPTPQENSLFCIRQIPGTETIVAVGNGSTIMYSDDDGDTWDITLNPAGLLNSTQFRAVNFIDEDNGYAADYYGQIIKTEDGGQSWALVYKQTHDSLRTDRVDIYLFGSETAIVVGWDRLIIKTEDSGENWETDLSPAGFYPKSIDFINQDTGFIVGNCSSDIILKTVNQGDAWVTHPFTNKNGSQPFDILFITDTTALISAIKSGGSQGDTAVIFKSYDSGKSWIKVHKQVGTHAVGEIDFKNDNNGAIRFYSWIHSFLYTTDGGNNWYPDYDDFFYNYRPCYSFFYGPEYIISVGRNGIIGKLYSNSEEWESLSSNTCFDICNNVKFLSNEVGYAHYTSRCGGALSGVLIKTMDEGSTWSSVYSGMYTADFSFLNEDIGFIAGSWDGGYSIETAKTTDGGNNWNEVYYFEPEDDFEYRDFFRISYNDETFGLMAYTGKIYRTSQTGKYWQEIFYSNDLHVMTDIQMFSADTFLVTSYDAWPSKSPVLIWSYDGGDNLIFDTLDQSLRTPNSIYFKNRNIAFTPFEQSNTILKSTDGGITWDYTIINDTSQSNYYSVYFPTDSIGYAVGSGPYTTMLKSTDGGETWNPIAVPSSSGLSHVYFHDELHGFVFGNQGVILETMTGGLVGEYESTYLESESFFTTYPNPVKSNVQFVFSRPATGFVQLEIFDISGKTVYENNIPSSISTRSVNLDLRFLKPGTYFCKIIFNGQSSVQKIIKL